MNLSGYLMESFFDSGAVGVDHEDHPIFLQVSATCNGKCIFCAEKNNPWGQRVEKLRSLREIKQILFSLEPPLSGSFELSRTYPGRLSEGEPLIHPHLREIISLIRAKFPNRIYMDTNGALLTDDLMKFLNEVGGVTLRISYPSFNPKYWLKVFQVLKQEHYEAATFVIKNRQRWPRVEIIPTTVAMPSWYGYGEVEQTCSTLSSLGYGVWLLFPPGYTKYTPAAVAELMQVDFYEFAAKVHEFSAKYNIVIDRTCDITAPIELPQIEPDWWLVTGELAYERFSQQHDKVVQVKNSYFGGNIGSVGLLTLKDIHAALDGVKGQTVVFSKAFLDKFGNDLEGNNFVDFDFKNEVVFSRGCSGEEAETES